MQRVYLRAHAKSERTGVWRAWDIIFKARRIETGNKSRAVCVRLKQNCSHVTGKSRADVLRLWRPKPKSTTGRPIRVDAIRWQSASDACDADTYGPPQEQYARYVRNAYLHTFTRTRRTRYNENTVRSRFYGRGGGTVSRKLRTPRSVRAHYLRGPTRYNNAMVPNNLPARIHHQFHTQDRHSISNGFYFECTSMYVHIPTHLFLHSSTHQ